MGSCQSNTASASPAVATTTTTRSSSSAVPSTKSVAADKTTATTPTEETTEPPVLLPSAGSIDDDDDDDSDDDSDGGFSVNHRDDKEEQDNENQVALADQPPVMGTQDTTTTINNNALSEEDEEETPTPPPPIPSGGMGLKRKGSRCGLDTMLHERRHSGTFLENVVPIETAAASRTAKPIRHVYDGVDDGQELGQGIAGVVRSVRHKAAAGRPYAVKVLNLNRLLAQPQTVETERNALRNEILIMASLDHPHICRLQEVYEDDDCLYLVQEVCWGGDLLDWMDEQPDQRFDEATARRVVQQMLSALRYLHAKGIVHRDLKMENFLLTSTAANAKVKSTCCTCYTRLRASPSL